MDKYGISNWNIPVAAALISLNITVYLGFLYNPLIILAASFFIIPYWSILHESVHSVFNKNKTVNDLSGRIMGIIFGSPFDFLKFGHLSHHRYNRSEIDRTEIFDPSKEKRFTKTLKYYFTIFAGLYLAEVLIPFLFFLPKRSILFLMERFSKEKAKAFQKISGDIKRILLKKETLGRVRTDAFFIIILFSYAFYISGENFHLLLFYLFLRAFIISFLDNIYHYGTNLSEITYSYNLHLNKLLSRFFLYFNYHRIHHKHPNAPWNHLPGLFKEDNEGFNENYFVQAVRQLKGPIDRKDIKG